ncbi:MAG: twin-arginine translocation signal domain-containing protein, partial [Deltaproteobacteria bacterium]
MSDEVKLSRRGFVKGAALAAGAAALLEGAAGKEQQQAGRARKLGPGPVEVSLRVNGKDHRVQVEPRATLASVLR